MEASAGKENGSGGKQKNTGKRRLSGRREYHASGGGKAVFFRTQNAWGTTNALFYFLGRGGGWAAVKLGFTTVYASSAAPSLLEGKLASCIVDVRSARKTWTPQFYKFCRTAKLGTDMRTIISLTMR